MTFSTKVPTMVALQPYYVEPITPSHGANVDPTTAFEDNVAVTCHSIDLGIGTPLQIAQPALPLGPRAATSRG
jgi:hypothetical protein